MRFHLKESMQPRSRKRWPPGICGQSYTWCSCGLSTSQVEKSGEYQMCMCKQTDHRPLCDGKHKNVSPIPRDAPTQGLFNIAFSDNSPVYEGVAKKLGYRPKNGGFQW
ncbi:unnamed protein product, partial [Mesorhabditis belari]|uniref:Iron-binding zinc finger CDGSH type domain-containing protein n=1 Tax=Mesorhabditis belari TaxID=2138241 RepID=A0AAF3FN50_9BILA